MARKSVSKPPVCKHTPKPTDFQECLKWRIEMSRKGFVQRQCKGCGVWAVWKKEKVNRRGK